MPRGDDEERKYRNVYVGSKNKLSQYQHRHFHPDGDSLSPDDIGIFIRRKANSFRAAGKYGTFVLTYEEAIELPEFDIYSNYYDAVAVKLIREYKLKNINMNTPEFIMSLGNQIWDKMYKKFGVKPTFEERI